MFEREGLSVVPHDEGRNLIGGGARRTIENALKLEGRIASPPEMDRMLGDFIAYYSDHVADRSRLLPGLLA